MKIRVWLVLLAVVCAVLLSGCQGSVAKTDKAAIATTEAENPCSKKAQKPVPQVKYAVSWEEKCLVEQASSACAMVLEDFGLGDAHNRSRTVRRRDSKTGRTVTQRISVEGRTDDFSSFFRGRTTAGIEFQISILLMPPETSAITVTATSRDQSKEVLKRQSEYLKQKISEIIQQGPAQEEPLPYPEMMIINRTVDEVFDAIYAWAREANFDVESNSGHGRFYAQITSHSRSGIHLNFTMRLIDSNKIKLEIDIEGYEGKEEFKMILKSLLDVLQSLEKDKPIAEEAAGT